MNWLNWMLLIALQAAYVTSVALGQRHWLWLFYVPVCFATGVGAAYLYHRWKCRDR